MYSEEMKLLLLVFFVKDESKNNANSLMCKNNFV